jgi:hypothetical protein
MHDQTDALSAQARKAFGNKDVEASADARL